MERRIVVAMFFEFAFSAAESGSWLEAKELFVCSDWGFCTARSPVSEHPATYPTQMIRRCPQVPSWPLSTPCADMLQMVFHEAYRAPFSNSKPPFGRNLAPRGSAQAMVTRSRETRQQICCTFAARETLVRYAHYLVRGQQTCTARMNRFCVPWFDIALTFCLRAPSLPAFVCPSNQPRPSALCVSAPI